MDYKALYEQQQQETDREHQRYLEVPEKYSDKLWEVCQELDIENDDTSKNIIEAINKLKEENKKLKEDVGHYKNSALYYWSHGKLGDQDCLGYPENWDECLNATDEDNCDTEALTKKCMEAE